MPVSVTPDTLCSRRYAPAALGNGSLSVTLGPEGDQRPAEFCGMTPEIVRAGFRLDNRIGELFIRQLPLRRRTRQNLGTGS